MKPRFTFANELLELSSSMNSPGTPLLRAPSSDGEGQPTRLRIALCDDDERDLERLDALTREALRAHGILADIVAYNHPDPLLSDSEKEPFDLYLLDVMMDMVTGIELVQELRQHRQDPRVVFFSTSHEYAYEAYQVDAITYVAKPYTKEQFTQAINKALAYLITDLRDYVVLGTEGNIRRFRARDIEYVTTAVTTNYIRIFLRDGTAVDTRYSIRRFADDYRDRVTLAVLGRALLVNPARIAALHDNNLRFYSGATLTLPRHALKPLRDAILHSISSK